MSLYQIVSQEYYSLVNIKALQGFSISYSLDSAKNPRMHVCTCRMFFVRFP